MKYIDGHGALVMLNQQAIAADYTRAISEEKIGEIADAKYPVIMSMPHNDSEMRCELILDGKGSRVFLDMSFEAWDSLPNHGQTDAGARVRMSMAS